MKLVYTSPVAPPVYHAKNLLEAAGIRCQVHGEHLASTHFFPQFWVELHIERDDDHARAVAILEKALGESGPLAKRSCPACSAEVEGPFANCWSCGADLDPLPGSGG